MEKQSLKLPDAILPYLRCPGRPEHRLRREGNVLHVVDSEQPQAFPIIDCTPILINEDNSIFLLSDYQSGGGVTTMDLRAEAVRFDTTWKRFKKLLNAITPPKSRSVSRFDVCDALKAVLKQKQDAKILVIGAGDERFLSDLDACIVYTDVALAPDTHLIADCHDIPFADGTFDAVVAVAVLEHVVDPFRCVAEMQRVLVSGGFIYAVTPFMQQVHMGRYDFTRFTALGHRRLLRWFDQLEAGVANGPGMSVAWSIEYFLSTFSENTFTRRLLRTMTRFLTWPFLLFDRLLAKKRGAYDCASAYYFFGQLRNSPVSDREILNIYRGLN